MESAATVYSGGGVLGGNSPKKLLSDRMEEHVGSRCLRKMGRGAVGSQNFANVQPDSSIVKQKLWFL